MWILHVRGVENSSGDFLYSSLRRSLFEAGSGKRLLFSLMVFGCVRGVFLEGCTGGYFGCSSFVLEVWMCGSYVYRV